MWVTGIMGCQEDRATISFWLWIELYHFEYTDISADKKEINERDTVTVKAKVKNTGNMTGKEIVQLYVRDIEHSVIRPEKELKEFCKVELAPGQEATVKFVLDKKGFCLLQCRY